MLDRARPAIRSGAAARLILRWPLVTLLVACGCSAGTSADTPVSAAGSGGASSDAAADVAQAGGMAGAAGSGGSTDSGGPGDAPLDQTEPVEAEAGQAGSGGTDAGAGCTDDAQCLGNPAGPVCDTATGKCVQCMPADPTTCPSGQYCDPSALTCKPGCDEAQDCGAEPDGGALTCDTTTNTCVGCTADAQCPAGQVCKANACEAGCTNQHPCQSGFACCSGACINTSSDVQHCGGCGFACQLPNATPACMGGKCALESCADGFEDCDKLPGNGCESVQGVCACTPNETQPCYSGPPGTEGVGACQGGTRTCNGTGTGWGGCVGEVLPAPETCYTAGDDNCDGQVNEGGTGCVCMPLIQEPCYTGPANTRNVGACQDGTHVCNLQGTAWGMCYGQTLPTPETCLTPVDDNCNGEVNELGGAGCLCAPDSVASCYAGPPGTQGIGVCKAGTQLCDSLGTGYGPCIGGTVPSPDVCTDNLDNDCNGVVNDGVSGSAAGCICFPGAVSACYSGPPSTQGVGACKAGTRQCNMLGTAYGPCNGELVPTPDHCTDLIDNDCNGVVNDGFGSGGTGCLCVPGVQQDCYTGPSGTMGVGVCKSGKRTCSADGKTWGACIGQVIPDVDSCLNQVDDDCNGVINDGFGKGGAGCVCLPGASSSCYQGPPGTLGVGPCKAGTATCNSSGTGSSACVGQVLPVEEICANGINDDCVGGVDDVADTDGDGWTRCNGDCCETTNQCSSPKAVNPGAIEVMGDLVDNNCNNQTDENPYGTCSTGTNFTTTVDAAKALALLNAMEICQISQNGSWGIVPGSYSLTRADGTGVPNYTQVAVTNQFGTDASNLPRMGSNFVLLSSGNARDASDPNNSTTAASYEYVSGSPPPDFIAPHGNVLPTTAVGCPNGSGANDSVRLRVQLKAPTNANSFSFQFRFFSQEYWSWTCTQYNDFFITMLNSQWVPGVGQTPIPADKNISFDANGRYISVNSTQFFTVCPPKTGYPCPNGTAGLNGTGYTLGPGGGTVWLTTTSPVKPGETITLRFVIWDTSDRLLDSIVLLDNFRWSATPSSGPITQ
jgi:Cys-rich repeat protein